MYERRIPFTMKALTQLSQEGLFTYQVEPNTEDFAYLLFSNGIRHYVNRFDFRVNFVGPYYVAKNKYVTDQFLKESGYPIIPSEIFYSENYCVQNNLFNKGISNALAYAKELEYPVIVKPNNGFFGNNVFKVNSESELIQAMNTIFEGNNNRLLVQKYFKANDYRVVIYRGKFKFAYQRTPLTMTGNGIDSISSFIENVENNAAETGRSVSIDKNSVLLVVTRLGYTLESIPADGEIVQLLDNANLSTGGLAIDVTNTIHPGFISIIENVCQTLNLNLSGVDLLIKGDISEDPSLNEWAILEVNGSPGFEGFISLGQEQEKRVMDMFREIVQDISEGHYATYLPKK